MSDESFIDGLDAHWLNEMANLADDSLGEMNPDDIVITTDYQVSLEDLLNSNVAEMVEIKTAHVLISFWLASASSPDPDLHLNTVLKDLADYDSISSPLMLVSQDSELRRQLAEYYLQNPQVIVDRALSLADELFDTVNEVRSALSYEICQASVRALRLAASKNQFTYRFT